MDQEVRNVIKVNRCWNSQKELIRDHDSNAIDSNKFSENFTNRETPKFDLVSDEFHHFSVSEMYFFFFVSIYSILNQFWRVSQR